MNVMGVEQNFYTNLALQQPALLYVFDNNWDEVLNYHCVTVSFNYNDVNTIFQSAWN